MASNSFFIALDIPDSSLKKILCIKFTLPSGAFKTSLHTSSPPKLVSLHCSQINGVKNKAAGQPSGLLAYRQVFDYKVAFTPIHLKLLELETHHCHLDFKLLDENNNTLFPKTFHLQLLYKDNEYI